MNTSQIITVCVLAVLLLLILPMYRSRTGKDISEILIGRKKNPLGAVPESKNEPHLNNGTAGDLRYFLSSLIKTAMRKKMKVVAPGRISSKGKTADVTAFLVHKSGITGIVCLGYNGIIRQSPDGTGDWTQHINGEDIPFKNPLSVRENYMQIIKPAFEKAGLDEPVDFVTVFTTNGVQLENSIADLDKVFYRNRFTDYIVKNADALNTGTLDVDAAAKTIAGLVGIEKLKMQEKQRSKQ